MKNYRMKMYKTVAAALLVSFSGLANAGLIGHWTFEEANPTQDLTGHFEDIVLFGDASIVDGKLDVNGNGSWARSGDYSGPTILDKTLVSWVSLESLDIRSGSALGLDAKDHDNFDALVFGERIADQWMNGSSFFSRTQDFNANAQATLNVMQQLVITYDDLDDVMGGDMRIEGFLDGVLLGSYVSSNSSSWQSGNVEALFGIRHNFSDTNTRGALDASILEARIYDTALSQDEVNQLTLTQVPEPMTLTLMTLGLFGLGARRLHK